MIPFVVHVYKVKEDDNAIGNISYSNTLKAWTRNGHVHISGLTSGKSYSIYDIYGKLVYHFYSYRRVSRPLYQNTGFT